MRTEFLLMAEFQSTEIRLEEIAEKYLGMTPAKARREAAAQSLPFPVFRVRNSQKSPLLVSIQDLAEHIDAQRDRARRDWLAVNT